MVAWSTSQGIDHLPTAVARVIDLGLDAAHTPLAPIGGTFLTACTRSSAGQVTGRVGKICMPITAGGDSGIGTAHFGIEQHACLRRFVLTGGRAVFDADELTGADILTAVGAG